MGTYRKASHVTYDCRYHIVWITKYRRKILKKKLRERLEAILRMKCKEMYIDVISIGIEEDHVHIYCSMPHSQHISYVLQQLKGGSSRIIRQEYEEYLREYYWKPFLWAVGYFVATVGEITHETVKKYVEQQGKQECLGEDIKVYL